jgi:predicted dehydrogenase
MQMWLYGTKGGSHWPANEILTTNNATRQHMNTQLTNAAGGEPHARECVAFADAVANGKPSPVPAEQSLIVMTILDGLYQSAEAGREIAIEL